MKKFLSFGIGAAALFALTACEDAEIGRVKNKRLAHCESYTIEQVMDSLMVEPFWGMDSDVSGRVSVVVEGMVSDDGQLYPMEFKFSVDQSDSTELLSFAIDQRSKPNLYAYKYFARVCADDYWNGFQRNVESAAGTAVDVAKGVAGAVKDTYKENEKEINEFSDKVIRLTGKALNKVVDMADKALSDSTKQ